MPFLRFVELKTPSLTTSILHPIDALMYAAINIRNHLCFQALIISALPTPPVTPMAAAIVIRAQVVELGKDVVSKDRIDILPVIAKPQSKMV
ncbi:MAG: hypothetical protein HZB37_07285 [Planctomycetes bacterium]|nr:hypothetical protein [Planctomycetota bacterium]